MAKAAELGVRELEVVSDSELLVKQVRGDYRVKNAALRVLWEEANDLERRPCRRSWVRVPSSALRSPPVRRGPLLLLQL
jgi:ribonuclease HI